MVKLYSGVFRMGPFKKCLILKLFLKEMEFIVNEVSRNLVRCISSNGQLIFNLCEILTYEKIFLPFSIEGNLPAQRPAKYH